MTAMTEAVLKPMSTEAERRIAKEKDQFFTAPKLAERCWGYVVETMEEHGMDPKDFIFVEPSAGAGAFIKSAPEGIEIVGYDVEPRHPEVKQANFLSICSSLKFEKPWVIIGNPPFGGKGRIAAQFISLSLHAGASLVCFVLPRVLESYQGQRNVSRRFGILNRWFLGTGEDGEVLFELPITGRPYTHIGGCDFQIWSPMHLGAERATRLPVSHPDFEFDVWGTKNEWRWNDELTNGTCDFYVPLTKYSEKKVYMRDELPRVSEGSKYFRFWSRNKEIYNRLKDFPYYDLKREIELQGNILGTFSRGRFVALYTQMYGEAEKEMQQSLL